MKRRIGDRRSKPRFEIVGELWGSVDIGASLAVLNLGRGGALLESPVQTHVRVRLLDISASGALLAPEEPLPVGIEGKLRLPLAGVPFETTVEVRRVEPAAAGRGDVAGVVLKMMPAEQQDTLEEFLRRAGN